MMNSGAPTESNVNLAEPRYQSGSSRVFIVIILICGIVALIAIVLAAYAVGKSTTEVKNESSPNTAASQTGNQQTTTPPTPAKKVWIIAIGHDYGAQEYVDPKGYLTGFNHDVITEVCKAARIICETVWAPYTNCWDSEPGKRAFGGEGVHGKWFDVCTGWYITIERQAVFQFSQPFLKAGNIYFYVKAGSTFNTGNVTGKKIGFLDGWAYDEKCLARTTVTGNILPTASVKHYATTDALKAAVIDGSVDAAFASEQAWKKSDLASGIEKRGSSQNCGITGLGMMTRKDGEFNTLWNMGFQKIKNNIFKKICSDAVGKHGTRGTVMCAD